MEVVGAGGKPVDRKRGRSNDTRAGVERDAARTYPRVSRYLLP